MSQNQSGVDRRHPPSHWRMVIQSWPIVSMIAASLVAGFMQWAELRRDISLFERRLMETDRRVVVLEASDQVQLATLTELKVTLAEIKTSLRGLQSELESSPRNRRRADAQPSQTP